MPSKKKLERMDVHIFEVRFWNHPNPRSPHVSAKWIKQRIAASLIKSHPTEALQVQCTMRYTKLVKSPPAGYSEKRRAL